MNYEQCIRLTMRALEKFLESHIEYTTDKNFNISHIELADDGFRMEEQSRFSTEYRYGVPSVPVSPFFVLKTLFNGVEDEKKDDINEWVKTLTDREYSSSISYFEIVKMIDTMRNNYDRGLAVSKNCVDMEYAKFKKYMESIPKDDYVSLKNQILSLKNLSYDSITNIRNERSVLARKIERMYQIELLLRKFCADYLVEEGYLKPTKEEEEFYWKTGEYPESSFDDIDFTKYKINWNEFCDVVRDGLYESYDKINDEEEVEHGYSRYRKLTVMGLDAIFLPTSPDVTARKYHGRY